MTIQHDNSQSSSKTSQFMCSWILDSQPGKSAIVTRTPVNRDPRVYKVQARSGDQYTGNRRFIHLAAESDSLGPPTPELSTNPTALPTERSVSAPSMHTATPRTTSSQC